jgi:DNA-binding beta-propeller fold protein YncE
MRQSQILGGIAVLLALGGALPAGAAGPTLTFQKMIGDLRGRFLPHDLQSLAVDDGGSYYVMSNGGTVAVFDPAGNYLRTDTVATQWPYTYRYLCALGSRVFFGDAGKDYPWVFSPQRVGSDPGRFQQPTMATLDSTGAQVYVADTGNNRVQRFAVDQTDTPNLVIPTDTPPTCVAIRGQTLAVLMGPDNQTLTLFDLTNTPPTLLATRKLDSYARSVALAPNGGVIVAYSYGQVLRYAYANGALTDAGVLTRAAMDDWPRLFPAGTPMITAPDGQIWFATDVYGKLMSLNPATDTVTEHAAPGRDLCLGFGPNGLLCAGGYPDAGQAGPSLAVVQPPALTKVGAVPSTGSLYKGADVPVWGILPDDDGGVYVRVVEEGWDKGWTALDFKKVYPDGTVKPWLDFGQLYAKRTTFPPPAAYYAMEFDAARNILLTAFPLESVMKVTPDGKILWEAGVVPQGGADRVDFVEPRDLAQDSAGDIWVIDSGSKKLYCLSPAGKLLFTFGGPGGIDDLSGQTFGLPTGVAIATVEGTEYLYVGDAGNNRLLKYQLDLP